MNGRRPTSAAVLLAPVVLLNLGLFVAPMVNLLTLAFRPALPGGGIGDGFSLDVWHGLVADSFYTWLVVNSVGIALLVTVLTLLCAYPLALFVHRASPRWKNLLIVACVSPLLVSAVVRTYGWLVILGDQGLVAASLRALGMARPPRLVFNTTGVVVALAEILMPTMILSLLAGFGRLNDALEEAAASLGANRVRVLLRVVLPLSLPGILLGCLLTFVQTVSSFITPKLLGGGRVNLLATEIYDQAVVTLNWPLAASLSIVVLAVFGLSTLLYGRAVRAAG
jgi:putative spermidine/putrescine transport system permease protein